MTPQEGNQYNQEGLTPLTLATKLGRFNYVTYFLESNFNIKVNDKDRNGGTPLHYASDARMAKYLIDKGANVNEADGTNRTPIHVAAEYGRIDVIRQLIEAGADKTATVNGKSAADFACASMGAINPDLKRRIMMQIKAIIEK